jgi:hypothetical protein
MLHKLTFILAIAAAGVVSVRFGILVADWLSGGRPDGLSETTLKLVSFVEKYWIPCAILFFMSFLI